MTRHLFRLFIVTILVAALLPAGLSVSWTVEIPKTLHARVALSAGDSEVSKALPFAANDLGISWRGPEEVPEIRTSPNGVTWSSWQTANVDEDLSDHEAGLWFSSLIAVDEARWVQMRTPASATPSFTVYAINTRDGPLRKVEMHRAAWAATPQPRVISRAEWGADESLRRGSPSFARVRKLFVHHTATANNDPDPKATIRAIYAYHTQSREWNDIGYNFLIDSNGNIYEGRYARNFAPGEIPNGENENGMGVVGAHAVGYNTGSAGVALLGDFTSVAPATAATGSLVELLAWKADRHGINPFGSDQGVPNIAGHRDIGSTACPGNILYERLSEIRNQVESRIQVTTNLTPPAMPAGTELFPRSVSRDLTPSATGAVSRSAVRVDLTFDGEEVLSDRVFSLTPQNGSFSLTDDDYLGLTLAQGRYAISAVAYDSTARASPVAKVATNYLVSLGDVPATGYWILGSDGGVFSYGSARFYGSMGGKPLNRPVVGMDGPPPADGYWLVASDGGIFAFGEAPFYGSTGAIRLNQPILDMASTATGNGYWLVASDGGIFAFGDARFYGSTGAIRLNQPIVGMTPTPTGGGYWLVASDGGIFAFGDARFYGSTGAIRLNQPIVGMTPTPTGGGYWLVASDGGIFAFGDARYYGSLPGRGIKATVSRMASTFTGAGYYLLGSDGSVYTFGDAPHYGSLRSSGIRSSAWDIELVP